MSLTFFSVSLAKFATDNFRTNQILNVPIDISQIVQMERTTSKDGILIYLDSFN